VKKLSLRLSQRGGWHTHLFFGGWPGRKMQERIWVAHTSLLRVGLLTFPHVSKALSN